MLKKVLSEKPDALFLDFRSKRMLRLEHGELAL